MSKLIGKWVTRYSRRGIAHQVFEADLPRIDDETLDSVVYLYPSEAEAEDGKRLGGSGFIIGIPIPWQSPPWGNLLCIVTNKHVVEGGSAVIRINTTDGKFDIIPLDGQKWFFHPAGDDIAVCPIGLNSLRHKTHFIDMAMFLTKEIIDGFKIGIGDDVFFVGRFVNHEGGQQNRPSIRFGNISQMPHEPIKQSDGFDQESFLVEARSIAGYSGSPVFVYAFPAPSVALHQQFSGEIREHLMKLPNVRPERANIPVPLGPWLMGIDYCHIRTREPVRSGTTGEPMHDWYVDTNTGMMGVVPVWKLTEIIHGEGLMAVRKKLEESERKRRAESPVSLDSASVHVPPASDANPNHREDFNSLLGEAVKKPAQED